MVLTTASLIAIAFKVFVEVFNNPFTDMQVKVDWYLMTPLTIAWLVGMATTVNEVDGIDGLATGVTAIAALILCIHMVRLEQHTVALLPLALFGCCLGFLPYNFYNARIILGGGAFVLGYALGTLSIVAGAKVATALLVVWMPILDFVWQLYCRWRRGQSMSLGDRGHSISASRTLVGPRSKLFFSTTSSPPRSGRRRCFLFCLLKLGVMVVAAPHHDVACCSRRHTGDATPTGH